jgi:hypothetical protein
VAAATHTISGSRFLRPELSRFIDQVAQPRPQIISLFVKTTAAPMPPAPDVLSSRFLEKPATPPVEAVTTPRTHSGSRFLPRKMLSRFIHQVAHTRPQIITRFLKSMAALMPPIPALFSSRFFSKPRAPPRHLRRHWPNGKPKGPDL